MATELISAILQVLVFTLIPFMVYLISKKKTAGFFDYIGLKKTTGRAMLLAAFASLVFVVGGIGLAILSPDIKSILVNPPSVTGKLRAMGFSFQTISILLVIAGLKTSLSEEILFRGFIAKRAVSKFGYKAGNLIQALLFASIHVIVFWIASQAGIVFLVFIFVLSGGAGYLIEFLNEKYGNGSILPGWLAHGLGNTISYFVLAFFV